MPGINWFLALLAFCIWVGTFGWYFYPLIRDALRKRARRR